ncbi:hypothetical protein ACEPPN_008496 [Leptodophora sp. 'Broadleaf-Isolate-01']
MSFGVSVADITSLIQLAWTTFEGAKQACGEHDDLTREVSSAHTVLGHLQIEIMDPDSVIHRGKVNRLQELEGHMRGCRRHLRRINRVLVKFNVLSEEQRPLDHMWKKIQFGNGAAKDISRSRLKLSTYMNLISMSLQLLFLGSQGRVERDISRQRGDSEGLRVAVELLLAKMKSASNSGQASREGSILSTSATEEKDDKEFWNSFRRDLVRRGFKRDVIREHKTLILKYVKELEDRKVYDEIAGSSKMPDGSSDKDLLEPNHRPATPVPSDDPDAAKDEDSETEGPQREYSDKLEATEEDENAPVELAGDDSISNAFSTKDPNDSHDEQMYQRSGDPETMSGTPIEMGDNQQLGCGSVAQGSVVKLQRTVPDISSTSQAYTAISPGTRGIITRTLKYNVVGIQDATVNPLNRIYDVILVDQFDQVDLPNEVKQVHEAHKIGQIRQNEQISDVHQTNQATQGDPLNLTEKFKQDDHIEIEEEVEEVKEAGEIEDDDQVEDTQAVNQTESIRGVGDVEDSETKQEAGQVEPVVLDYQCTAGPVVKSEPEPEKKAAIQPPARIIYLRESTGREVAMPWEEAKTWHGIERLIQRTWWEAIYGYLCNGEWYLLRPGRIMVLQFSWENYIKPEMTIDICVYKKEVFWTRPITLPPAQTPKTPSRPSNASYRHPRASSSRPNAPSYRPTPPPPPPPTPSRWGQRSESRSPSKKPAKIRAPKPSHTTQRKVTKASLSTKLSQARNNSSRNTKQNNAWLIPSTNFDGEPLYEFEARSLARRVDIELSDRLAIPEINEEGEPVYEMA